MVPAVGGDLGAGTREALAETSKDPEVLAALAEDGHRWVRREVAKNPNTLVATLEMLAGDKDSGVRWRVAENPNTPAAILEVLAGDESSAARQVVAGNPNTPVTALELLARDEGSWVRQVVATSPSTPISVVVELRGDPNPHIAATARTRFTSWVRETLDLGSAPTEQLIDMLIALKAWELDPQDPAVTAAIVLCN